MTTQRLGVIMNGVTGRMGLNQHLIRSIIAIRDSGGVLLGNGDRVMPDPILVGRDSDKVERLARRFNVERWTTDLDKALLEPSDSIFFDAATTQARPSLLTKAINAGTSTSGPITAAKATPELRPKTATATAMASSKLLLAAVNESVAVCE